MYTAFLRKPKLEIERKSQKTISSFLTTEKSLNIQIDKTVYSPELETKNVAGFSSESLSSMVVTSNLQKVSTLTLVELTTSTKTHVTAEKFEAIEIYYDVYNIQLF